jgi:hypothetical protein
VLRVLGWNYASVVHTQTDYGTTAVCGRCCGCWAGTTPLWCTHRRTTAPQLCLYVLRVLGWNYASVVHTQTDYGTTAVFVGAAGAGLELRLSGGQT